MISHVMDLGVNYWSLWNFHQISAKNLLSYYQASPSWFDRINRRTGYRVRPSFIWSYKDSGCLGLIVGFANDGTAGVPGVLRVTVESEDGKGSSRQCCESSKVQVLAPSIACIRTASKSGACGGNEARSART
jgi:hypothetical protein